VGSEGAVGDPMAPPHVRFWPKADIPLCRLLGLFVQMIPTMKVIGLVTNSYNPNVELQLKRSEDAIRELGLQSRVAEARTSDEFERAFANLKAGAQTASCSFRSNCD
jgi:ABC-type uncharacterized transport system substrate-binding protein